MPTPIAELRAKIAAQKANIPAIYGDIDFDLKPERFADETSAETALRPQYLKDRGRLLANTDQVARIRAYTMLGDNVADAYAALMPEYGFRGLVSMLTQACEVGVDQVRDAPPELVAFIAAMEHTPSWLDRDLVNEGARLERNMAAHAAPYTIRGAFVATFMNKYAALPMALTGQLSSEGAAKRVKETATFFTCTVLPGALERHGEGFKSAAMVRLMHSMVRFNALRRGAWDQKVYGIPIPQVDQMPAGMLGIFLLAQTVLRKGRNTFTPAERARVELSRYRCYLLGLPEDLLADTPQGVVDAMLTRHATLRKGFDDATCGELVRATMSAYMGPDESLKSRIKNAFERSFGKFFFVRTILAGDEARAASMGVRMSAGDKLRTAAVGLLIVTRVVSHRIAQGIPGLREVADKRLIKRIRRQLETYGHAEFTSDASTYKPVAVAA